MRETLHAAALSSFTVKCKKSGVELSHGRAAKVELPTFCPERSLRHYLVHNIP